jgi:hypothetical protein
MVSHPLLKTLGDHLLSVKFLSLDFYSNYLVESFEYFFNNCKLNLKKLAIWLRKGNASNILKCVVNYQIVHNLLKVLEISSIIIGQMKK